MIIAVMGVCVTAARKPAMPIAISACTWRESVSQATSAPTPAPRPLAELLDEVFARLSATGEPVLPFLEREMTARAQQAGQDQPGSAPAPRAAKAGAKRGKARR